MNARTAPQNGHVNDEAFDLDAAIAAAQAEATRKPFTFTFKGRKYAIPNQADWPLSAVEKLSKGDIETALGQLLGPDDYRAMVDAGMTIGGMTALMDKVSEASGTGDLPNSSVRPQLVSRRK